MRWELQDRGCCLPPKAKFDNLRRSGNHSQTTKIPSFYCPSQSISNYRYTYPCTHQSIEDYLLDSKHSLLHDFLASTSPIRQGLDILYQSFTHGYGISILILGILSKMFLLTIVGEVYLAIEIFSCVGAGRSTHVWCVEIINLK